MTNIAISLTDEVLKLMRKYEFSQPEIDRITSSDLYKEAATKDEDKQRALLKLLFFRVVAYSTAPLTRDVSLALNSTDNTVVWLDNFNLIIIPYIKNNDCIATTTSV